MGDLGLGGGGILQEMQQVDYSICVLGGGHPYKNFQRWQPKVN
jgi:hypothetical protein